MTYQQIFEAETRNSDEEIYLIHFYKEGLWWKAWEWSAYLYTKFMSDLMARLDKKKLNILKRWTKQNQEQNIVCVGLPIEAYNNYLVGFDCFEIISDTHIVYDLSKWEEMKYKIDGYIDVYNYEEVLLDWKDRLPFSDEVKMQNNLAKQKAKEEKLKKKNETPEPMKATMIKYPEEDITDENRPYIFDDIIEEISKYQIESKTMVENTNFIIYLRNILNSLSI